MAIRRFVVAVLVVVAACSGAEPRPRLELVEAPGAKDVAPLISGAIASAESEHKKLLVYVGASWCEPCRHFHEAAVAGQLDAAFGGVRLLVFDADRDGDALRAAGYDWRLIPLFALPKPDGTASGKQIEGSIKGEGAVAQISPRLQALLQ
jgi:thiol-disulfide isomerase/thioredoxin